MPLLSDLAIQITAVIISQLSSGMSGSQSLLSLFSALFVLLSLNTPVNTNTILPEEPQLFCLNIL